MFLRRFVEREKADDKAEGYRLKTCTEIRSLLMLVWFVCDRKATQVMFTQRATPDERNGRRHMIASVTNQPPSSAETAVPKTPLQALYEKPSSSLDTYWVLSGVLTGAITVEACRLVPISLACCVPIESWLEC